MRGFVLGSLGLIVLQVLLQPGSADSVAAGGNIIAATARRLLSADVAGVPQIASAAGGKSTARSVGALTGRTATKVAGIIGKRREA
jgi:hypothetical protein